MEQELRKRKLSVRRQVVVPIVYDGLKLDEGFRIDLFVENSVIIEIKAVERALPVHAAQVLTYMRLTDVHLGFLMNFNVPVIKDGIKRFAR